MKKEEKEKSEFVFDFEYVIRYTRSFFKEITVDEFGTVIVHCNKRHSKKEVLDFIKKKETWIKQKIKHEIENHKPLAYGQSVLFLGDEYLIKETKNEFSYFDDKENVFYINKKSKINLEIEKIYRQKALCIIGEYLNRHSKKITGFKHDKFKVTAGRCVMGRCRRDKNNGNFSFDFSWKLISAPLEVIEYVVIHELCHTIEFNHRQDKFWKLVSIYCPDFKIKEDRLKKICERLEYNCI